MHARLVIGGSKNLKVLLHGLYAQHRTHATTVVALVRNTYTVTHWQPDFVGTYLGFGLRILRSSFVNERLGLSKTPQNLDNFSLTYQASHRTIHATCLAHI